MKILHVVDQLPFTHSGAQVRMLAPIQAEQHQVEVVCLGEPTGDWPTEIPLHVVRWHRWLNLSGVWELRRILKRLNPDVIHGWRWSAARSLSLTGRYALTRTVLSSPIPTMGKLTAWDRQIADRLRGHVVEGAAELAIASQLGVANPATIPSLAHVCADTAPTANLAGIHITCIGRMEPSHGYRYAIWALDILNHIYADLSLEIVGQGSLASNLQHLAVGLRNTRVEFAPTTPADVAWSRADLCWIPSVGNVGRQTALEAMSRGLVVFASAVPCLRDLIEDGVTGFLIPPRDPVALAKSTHRVLQDEALRRRVGAAARQQVQNRHDAVQIASQWDRYYTRTAA